MLLILGFGFWMSPDFKTISAGVAIFLFGMLSLEEGFRAFTGGALERLLRHTTSSTYHSLGFGIISTTIMQSSSLVSVITISFLSAGLITLAAGIGIIFGANLGTTTGAWLVAGFGLKVNIASYAMPMLVFGVIMMFQPSKQLKGAGYILSGLGFLFLGIHYMKEGFDAFSGNIDLSQFSVSGYPGLFLFALIGIIATVVMQSSHATLVLIITALSVNQISYENALALAIGSNVGTTITAIIGAMSANEAGKRLASAHLIFNLVTGIIAIALIYQLMEFIDWFAKQVDIADDDYSLKLAVFHTIFNLIGVLVMLPFIGKLVTTLERVIPEKVPEVDQPKYLSDLSADYPGTAVEALRNETIRIFDAALRVIINGLGFRKEDVMSDADIEQVASSQSRIHQLDIDAVYERRIKGIYSAIIAFISTTTFSRHDEHSARIHWLRDASMNIVESVKDTKHLQKNLVRYVGPGNKDMKAAYNQIRMKIAYIIREIDDLRNAEGGVIDMTSLEALKQIVNEDREKFNNSLSDLIGRGAISPIMGSSLMNDSGYAINIMSSLIQAAETLYVARDSDLTQTVHDILDDYHDLDNVNTKNPVPQDETLNTEHADGLEHSAR
ncbi:MAG: Na/Pi symporter [Gammaproteobacteria bacterium]|nr:Na/Pi symporter [Gammaproteobacteria bacterium]MBT8134443.1 Na/Pi symporter [Gammaproteobacteria bacterium]NNJ50143.1 Na/Pi cotransporter family protein [Gammaproteobacteria bacterium]